MNDQVTIGSVCDLLKAVGLKCYVSQTGQSFCLVIEGTSERIWKCNFYPSVITATEYLKDKEIVKIEQPNNSTHYRNIAFLVLKLLATRLQKGLDISPKNSLTLKERLEYEKET